MHGKTTRNHRAAALRRARGRRRASRRRRRAGRRRARRTRAASHGVAPTAACTMPAMPSEEAERDAEHHDRRDEVADAVRRREPACELAAPEPGREHLPGEPLDARARAVGDGELGREPHRAAGLAKAAVELPVLAALDGLVEEADAFERRAAEHAEVDGVGRPLLAADVERRAAEADLAWCTRARPRARTASRRARP